MGLFLRGSQIILIPILLHQVASQQPTLTVTSIDDLEGVPIGGSLSINCTVIIPSGYVLGTPFFPGFFTTVTWLSNRIGLYLSRNTTTIDSDTRVSAVYFNNTDSGVHIFELTIADLQISDSGVYTCSAYTYLANSSSNPGVTLSDNAYISVADILYEDKPQCYNTPDDTIFEGLGIRPTCILKNSTENQTVTWSVIYPNGNEEPVLFRMNVFEGSTFKQFSSYFGNLQAATHEGVKFTCNVTLNGGSSMSCTTGEVHIIEGAKISEVNLLGGNIGETAMVSNQIEFPSSEYYITSNTWSKIIGPDGYLSIVNGNVTVDSRVDSSRYTVLVDELNGVHTNTLTISNLQESDTGYYSNSMHVGSKTSIMSTYYLQFFRIAVGYDLFDTIPRCELRSHEGSIPLDDQFRMDCTVKRSDLPIEMTWVHVKPDGTEVMIDSNPTGGGSEPINYMTRYVRPTEPYSDYIGSTFICSVTNSDLPGESNNCTFGPFTGPTTMMTSTQPPSTPFLSTQPPSTQLLSTKFTTEYVLTTERIDTQPQSPTSRPTAMATKLSSAGTNMATTQTPSRKVSGDPMSTTTTSKIPEKPGKRSQTAQVLIVAAAVVGAVLLLIVIIYCVNRKRSGRTTTRAGSGNGNINMGAFSATDKGSTSVES